MKIRLLSGELIPYTPPFTETGVKEKVLSYLGLDRAVHQVQVIQKKGNVIDVLVSNLIYEDIPEHKLPDTLLPTPNGEEEEWRSWWVSPPQKKDHCYHYYLANGFEDDMEFGLENKRYMLSYTHFKEMLCYFRPGKGMIQYTHYHPRKEDIKLENPTPYAIERLDYVRQTWENDPESGDREHLLPG